LLLQSLAAGFGVGVGAMFRTLDRLEYSIGLHVVSLALMTPLAYVLIGASGAVGGAWFHGLRSLIVTMAGIGLVLALSKSSILSAAQAESPVETHKGAGETTSRVPARSWTAR
jgi:hypothetical protein